MAKIKFPCQCGKSLSADESAAGKQAKCPSCGNIVKIPSVDSAVRSAGSKASAGASLSSPSPLKKSIWDDDLAKDLADPPHENQAPLPAAPASAAAIQRTGIVAKIAGRPWWFNWVAFLVYLAVVWVVSRSSPMGSLLLVIPVFFVAVLFFFVGGLWYFLVLLRDDPGQATTLFFALLLSFIFGRGAAAAGYQTGKKNRDKPTNPSHARPIAIMKFGGLGLAFALGATLVVGILLRTWTKESFRRARFDNLRDMRPPMRGFER